MNTTIFTRWVIALIGLLAVSWSGCHSGAYLPRDTTQHDYENRAPLVLMDARMRRSVTCSGIQESRSEDGRLSVVANLRNRRSRRIHVQVSCVFKGSQGFSTGDETPWKDMILTENAQESVRFTAMNAEADRYTIRVRQAH